MSVSTLTRNLRASGSPIPDLEYVERKARRMFTPRKPSKPRPTVQPYKPLSPKTPRSLVDSCDGCGRPSQGQYCRECYTTRARARHDEFVQSEQERVNANEAAFHNVVQKEASMATKKKIAVTPITRSTSGLRSALFEEMEALRSGVSNAQRARSVAMMANSILQSVQVEIEYHKYVNANHGKVVGDSKVVTLGTDISLAA